MKPLNQTEVEQLAEQLQEELLGAQLQEVYFSPLGLCLKLYTFKKLLTLFISMDPQVPFVYLFDSQELQFPKIGPKPIALFIKAHALHFKIHSIVASSGLGRVVDLTLRKDHQEMQLRLILIPKQPNLIASFENLKVSWNQEKTLSPQTELPNTLEQIPFEVRSLETLKTEWKNNTFKNKNEPSKLKNMTPQAQWTSDLQKMIQKKTQSLEKIAQFLDTLQPDRWFQVGELLKYTPLEELLNKWPEELDPRTTVSENIQKVFSKAKLIQKKREGTLQREKLLKTEIENLQKTLDQGYNAVQNHPLKFSPNHQPRDYQKTFKTNDIKFRKLELTSETYACLGKSAKDNLALLRKARPWDLWLHFKDYPGAHAIIFSNKSTILSDILIEKVGKWIASESIKSKASLQNQDLEIVYTPCRFVRPIKGDKLGRVQYQNAKVLKIKA